MTPVAQSGVSPGSPVQSPSVGPVAPANTAPTATNVNITGTAEVGQTLTGNYTYDDSDNDPEGTSTYRWLRNGSPISGATGISYTLVVADEGANIIFEVTPVAQSGVSPGSPVQSPSVGPVAPANTAPTATNVNITGTAEVGQTLTGNYTYDDSDNDPEGTSTYRWLRNGSPISGATGISYTLVVADEGANIIFEVTPVAQSGVSPGSPVQSPSVGPVAPANTAPTATNVNITGTAEVGQTLTGNYTYDDADNDPEGTSTYRWLRNGSPISGATGISYTLVVADEGANIIFEVTPVAQSGVSPGSPVQSPSVGPVAPANTAPTATNVNITGTAEVGQTLTGNYTYDDADNDPEGTSTYRWLRNGSPISGATGISYTLVVADEGANIIFEVTPVAQSGVSPGSPVQSPSVGPVAPANTAPTATNVNITGTTEVGETLTGNYTYNDADGDTEGNSTYRWLRDGSPISGAILSTYNLVVADQGTIITFEVTPVAQSGVSPGNPVQSPGVGPIGAANGVPFATDVNITGSTEVGQTLTGNYTYNDADNDPEGTSTYRWLRDGVAITGATNQTYTLVAADIGANIIFEVTPVAQTGSSPGSAVQSPPVGPITPVNTPPTASGVNITGTTEVGQTLTGNYSYNDAENDPEGNSLFRWLRNGVALTGATNQTYTLVAADLGANIIFEVTPVAQTGDSPGTPVQSPAVGPVSPANAVPTATNVNITGSTEVGQTLTGNYTYNDADDDPEGTSTYRWLRDGQPIAGAVQSTYNLVVADQGTVITFEVTPVAQTGASPGTPVQSPGVGPIGAANGVPIATNVSISGATEVGEILTGNYSYNDADNDPEGTSTYRWLRDGTPISGATFQTYTLELADLGTNIIFEVTPVAATGASPGSAVQSPSVGPITDVNTPPIASNVNIVGNPLEGETLTGNYDYSDADGDPEGNSTFRWLRDGTAIVGATSLQYTLQINDVGATIVFEVTPVAQSGTSPGNTVLSPGLGPIIADNTAPVASDVNITGDTEVGQVLTGEYDYDDADGDPEGNSTYRWLRDGVAITGATSINYTLVTADLGATIVFEVTPVAQTGISPGSAVQSAGVGPIGAANRFPTATNVEIDGSPEVGEILTGDYDYQDADNDQEGTSTFRWLRDGVAINDATNIEYTLVAADIGANIIFEVTPVAQTGASPGSPVQSAPIGPVVAANAPPVASNVVVSGSPQVGETLTGNYVYQDADDDPEGTSTFRWLRNGSPISGATGQTYTLQQADLGTMISFEVLPVAQAGDSPGRLVQSVPVGPVIAANAVPVASNVNITGSTEIGSILTGNYTYTDADDDAEGTSTFRWLRNGDPIDGAVSITYTLQDEDLSATIAFEVTPVAQTGASPGEPEVSPAVGPIGEANSIPSATEVTISGRPEVGLTLTGSYIYVDADGDLEGKSTFRWLRNGNAIPAATLLTYTLMPADLGAMIRFEVTPIAETGANPGGAVSSSAVGPIAAANSAPVASAVTISGIAEVGQQLNGIYTYNDADNDPEGSSTFRWLRDKVAIENAVTQSYRLANADLGAEIVFEVTPVAQSGLSPGNPATSAPIGPIKEPDLEPISITGDNLPRFFEAGSGDQSYSVEVGGDIEVERVLFIFKGLTSARDAWVTRDLQSESNRYSISIPEDTFDEMGLEYEFIASDVEGNSVNLLGITYIRYPGTGIDFESMVFGNRVTHYNMISAPLTLDNRNISSILEDDLGPYNQEEWRLFTHTPDGVVEYQEGLNELEKGKGYWLIARNSTELNTGAGTTELSGDAPFQLSLVPGWNLIGNPYLFNVSWTEVLESNPAVANAMIDELLTVYQGGYDETEIMVPTRGAFVFSDQILSLRVPLQKNETIQGGRISNVKESQQKPGDWNLSLDLIAGQLINSRGGIGMRSGANDGRDNHDAIRAPRFLEYMDINIPHPEHLGKYFSRDIISPKENHEWAFTVETNVNEPLIELQWDNNEVVDLGKELWLYHIEEERVTDMSIASSYSFRNRESNSFSLLYGDEEFVKDLLVSQKPTISTAYPNPFDNIVKVEIGLPTRQDPKQVSLGVYDINGRRVNEIWSAPYQAGFYTITWDGENAKGISASPGVYILRLDITGEGSVYRRLIKK